MMTGAEIMEIFKRVGAVITNDHFVYTSGLHGTDYINKRAIYQHSVETSLFCREIARQFVNDDVEAVVGPEEGGIVVSRWVAFHLSREKSADQRTLAFHADKMAEGHFVFKRGGATRLLPGKRVLVVDDILTTGASAKGVIEATQTIGGNVIGLGVLCNRSRLVPKEVANLPKMFSLVNLRLYSWTKEECERIGPCSKNIPINPNLGHGAEFLASRHRGERVS